MSETLHYPNAHLLRAERPFSENYCEKVSLTWGGTGVSDRGFYFSNIEQAVLT
jgi:hypothetical protein